MPPAGRPGSSYAGAMTAADAPTASTSGAVVAVLAAGAAVAAALWWALQADAVPLQAARAAAGVGFAGLGAWLSWVDVRTHRLPTRPVLTGVAAFGLVVLAHLAWQHDPAPAVRALVGALGLSLAFALVALAAPGSVGGGDVKLALLTGGITAWAGWASFTLALLAAFLLAGLLTAALLALRRARRTTRIPFGPFLCAGVWAGLLLA